LNFKRGGSRNGEEEVYVLQESVGSLFLMSDDARYVWQHGLPPVDAIRVSVTIRFFKHDVLAKHLLTTSSSSNNNNNETTTNNNTNDDDDDDNDNDVEDKLNGGDGVSSSSSSSSLTTAAASVQVRRIPVTLVLNKNQSKSSIVLVNNVVDDINVLRTLAKNKLRVNAKKSVLMRAGGAVVRNGDVLEKDERLYVGVGEAYAGPAAPRLLVASGVASPAAAAIFDEPLIEAAMKQWSLFKYASLVYRVRLSKGAAPGALCDSIQQLSDMIEASVLSVPEFRSLLLQLDGVVAARTDLHWAFESEQDSKRHSRVSIGSSKLGWLTFEVSANLALNGAKKRDGELWRLQDPVKTFGSSTNDDNKNV
jgi:hypothetical protein